MLTRKDLYEYGLQARQPYLNPPIDRCYDVCSDFVSIVSRSENFVEESGLTISKVYLGESVPHHIVEVSSDYVFGGQRLLVDPTLDQFTDDQFELDNVSISLGSDLPKVSIFLIEESPY